MKNFDQTVQSGLFPIFLGREEGGGGGGGRCWSVRGTMGAVAGEGLELEFDT